MGELGICLVGEEELESEGHLHKVALQLLHLGPSPGDDWRVSPWAMIELGGGEKFVGVPEVTRKAQRFFETLCVLTGWSGHLTIFSPPKREYSSVKETLGSKPKA
jgi:hypothetical protein